MCSKPEEKGIFHSVKLKSSLIDVAYRRMHCYLMGDIDFYKYTTLFRDKSFYLEFCCLH